MATVRGRSRGRFHFGACWTDKKESMDLVSGSLGHPDSMGNMHEVAIGIRRCSSKFAVKNAKNRWLRFQDSAHFQDFFTVIANRS
ncbi:hypothetical protein QYF36_000702 [Acer negundo]|nr:hypothetical protein QYF36_000702 [Acer negundo]